VAVLDRFEEFSLGYDADATERRRSAAQSRFDALADRPGENGDE